MTRPRHPAEAPAEKPPSSVAYVEVGDGDAGQRIDNFLLKVLKRVPKSHVYRILRRGEVRVNGGRAKPEYRIKAGDRVRVPPIRMAVEDAPGPGPSQSLQRLLTGSILHEDRELLVLNKPAGVAVHGGSGQTFGVIEALRVARPELRDLELVHRLDKETSGCLMLAKKRSVLRELHGMFREREMDKEYLALVHGRWTLGPKHITLSLVTHQRQGGERVVRVDAEGQAASSKFRPARFFGKLATLMEVSIGTGRTHQIRVHAQAAGHPIAGDDKYGDRDKDGVLKAYGLKRMFLHAHKLSFVRPGGSEPFSVTAPLDDELARVLERLETVTGRAAGVKREP